MNPELKKMLQIAQTMRASGKKREYEKYLQGVVMDFMLENNLLAGSIEDKTASEEHLTFYAEIAAAGFEFRTRNRETIGAVLYLSEKEKYALIARSEEKSKK